MTQDGVSVYSAWAESSCEYTTLSAPGATSVEYINGGNQIGFSGIQYIEGQPLFVADDTSSTNFSYDNDYPISSAKCLIIGSDTYVKFESSETFTLSLDEEGIGVVCIYPNGYSDASQNVIKVFSEDGTESRLLQHEGYRDWERM